MRRRANNNAKQNRGGFGLEGYSWRAQLPLTPLSEESAAKVNEIVDWMAAEVERTGCLDHAAAALEIGKRYFGFVYHDEYMDKHGKTYRVRRLHRDVVTAFRRRTATTVVAEKDDRAWRKRKSSV
jgi:transcriptional regulator GlxA family with amidase domain